MINHIRIDERLAHGQVCLSWYTYFNCSKLLVLDDPTAADPFLKVIVMGAVPRGVNAEVVSSSDIENIVKEYNGNPDNSIMIVTKTPSYVIKLLEANATDIKLLNVGNMGGGVGKTRTTNYTYITDSEKEEFLKINEMGVEVQTRQLPNDNAEDFIKCIHEAFK